jgi:hypothetical protein
VATTDAAQPPTSDPGDPLADEVQAPAVTPRPQRPAPAAADRRAPGVHVGRAATLRRFVRVPVRCSERCRVQLVVRQGRRVVARRAAWLAQGRAARIVARLGLRTRPGLLRVQVRVADAHGNAVVLQRTSRRGRVS